MELDCFAVLHVRMGDKIAVKGVAFLRHLFRDFVCRGYLMDVSDFKWC